MTIRFDARLAVRGRRHAVEGQRDVGAHRLAHT
jgi:hypothetical protein